MIRPDELKSDKPLVWSAGTGTHVWAMFCAAHDGDIAAIKRLLQKDPSLIRCQFGYRTPLYFAVRENQLEVTRFLLEGMHDPLGLALGDSFFDIARDRGYTEIQQLLEMTLARVHNISSKGEPVAAAIRERNLNKVRTLLDASPDLLHAGDLRACQPIHWAVMTRQLDAIDELLKRGADINAKRADGARPIQLTNGDYHYRGWRDVPKDVTTTPREVLDHLRKRGAHVDICTAAFIGDLARVRELLDADPSLANLPSDYISYYASSGAPLKNAALSGNIEIVKLLLERGADPNQPEEGIAPRGHALHSAVVKGHIEIVKLLLAHGAHANVEIESSADTLSAALGTSGYSLKPNSEMVELLCSHGAARRVHLLAYSGDIVTAAAMFYANPKLADDSEALCNAASQGHETFVRLMLRYESDLPKRITFPPWGMGGKTREINELLFARGMNPSQRDWLGITPLHHMARKGDLVNAEIFLDYGADLHARDEDICSTPLAHAAKCGKLEMVEFLLKRGAKTNLPDDPSWATPLAWATRRGHTKIAEILRNAGATT